MDGKFKLGFFESESWQEDFIKNKASQLGAKVDFYFFKEKLDCDLIESKPDLIKDLDLISVFICSKIDRKILENFSGLKFITTRSTGFDHIDLDACAQKSVVVSFVPHYGDNTVAEWTFGLILNLARKIYLAIDQIKESGSYNLDNLQGQDIKNRTLGVIGTGRIGKEVIKIAKGFSMNVIAYDLYPDQASAQTLGFSYREKLEDVLAQADIITLHAPLSEKTFHLINQANIGLIKKGALIVNTARGALIETDALVKALDENIVAGAALDVLEEEGVVKDEMAILAFGHPEEHNLRVALEDHLLMKMPNVLITPHNAFNSKEALIRILQTTIDNIDAFIQGKPINIVPKK